MGRRIFVRWDLTVGPDNRDEVVLLPEGRRFSSGELRPTIAEISSLSLDRLKTSMQDPANHESLLAHFDYEKALSGYIATYPHHLEDGLTVDPDLKIRGNTYPDRTRVYRHIGRGVSRRRLATSFPEQPRARLTLFTIPVPRFIRTATTRVSIITSAKTPCLRADFGAEHRMAHFGDYQTEIYLGGVRGILPRFPVDFHSLEQRAQAAMPPAVLSYVQGGCGDEFTQRANVEAFHRWGIVPRMLVDCSSRDLSIELFGIRLPTPIFLSPIGVLGICSPTGHGDREAARAAVLTGVPMVASTLSNAPLELIAEDLGGTPGFFQLYTPKDKAVAESLVRRAEAAGFKGIVVTLDTWLTGWRPRDLNTANFPQLRGSALANYFSDPCFRRLLARPPEEDLAAAITGWAQIFGKTLTWSDLPWLRSLTKLPLILKGICHPEDASRAIDAGADAIYCSNHGGRQANGGVSALDLLPGILDACGKTPVLFDSGVRSGTDIAKALAMGATAVGVGRPYAYGLALGGTDGVVHVLKSLLAEADLLMAVDGFVDIAALRQGGVVPLPMQPMAVRQDRRRNEESSRG